MLGLVAVFGAIPVFAHSVFVSNTSAYDYSNPSFVVIGTPVPYCQASGTSSAMCGTEVSGRYGSSYAAWNGSVSAAAAFGALSGSFGEFNGSSGYFVTSFGDEVLVTGGSGTGTLVAHYALSGFSRRVMLRRDGSFFVCARFNKNRGCSDVHQLRLYAAAAEPASRGMLTLWALFFREFRCVVAHSVRDCASVRRGSRFKFG